MGSLEDCRITLDNARLQEHFLTFLDAENTNSSV